MALASSQFTQTKHTFLGPRMRMVTGVFTGSASYASGGEELTFAIAQRGLGLKEVYSIQFQPLLDENNAALAVGLAFDNTRTSTTLGKLRAVNAGSASHTHDISIIGGQAAAGTNTVTCPAATDLLGKEEAGNALILGADVATKGGVVASTAGVAGSEVAAATNLSGYVSRFVAYGC